MSDKRVAPSASSFGDIVDARLALDFLLSKLEPEEREILILWKVEEKTFAEIGKIVGLKYRGRRLTGSAIRYHKDRIKKKLDAYRQAVGLE